MRVVNNYVARSVAGATLLVLVVFMGLDLIFRLVDEVDNIEGNYTFLLVVAYELLNTPGRFYEVMPIVGLVGCLTGLGALANTSELVVMRSAGISNLRLVWLAMRPAFLFLFVAMLIGEYIAPITEPAAISLRAHARYGEGKELNIKNGLWLRDENRFVFVKVVQPSGVMYGLNIFEFDESDMLVSIRRAKRATYNKDYWLLEKVKKTDFHTKNGMPTEVSMSQKKLFRWKTDLHPDLLRIASVKPDDLKMTDLLYYIAYLKKQSLNSIEYELAFWEKVFYPLVMLSLVLVGISFIFGPLRSVTMGYRIFWGIMLGIIFKTLQDTLGPFSIVFGFSPVIAMIIPVLLCMLLGAVLLVRAR